MQFINCEADVEDKVPMRDEDLIRDGLRRATMSN